MEPKKKTYIADINRGIYDLKNEFTYSQKTDKGLNEDIVREISRNKKNLNGYLKKG